MQSRLIVKNFGPIDFVDLDLRNVNVFIGPQASGKSALAKLFTIFKAPRKFLKTILKEENTVLTDVEESFKEVLEEYNITSFLQADTFIKFDSELHVINYHNGVVEYEPKLLNRIRTLEKLNSNFEQNHHSIKEHIWNFAMEFFSFHLKVLDILKPGANFVPIKRINELEQLTKKETDEILNAISELEIELSTNAALYIPAERHFINIIKKSSLNLLLNKVPIPKNILAFGAEIEKASIDEIDLDFLLKELKYKNINGEERIFTDQKNSILLSQAASGIQSVIPILIPVLSHSKSENHRSFVIEEPELNLFPTAQYELIKKLESTRLEPIRDDVGAIHTYTTHSPYILSAINNLLYAHKVKSQQTDMQTEIAIWAKIRGIVSTYIDPAHFTAYEISNGQANSIFDRETGLIMDNYIDQASDKMADDFDALMNLMK